MLPWKPFVKGNKNDRNDALAICEAAQRPNIHLVLIKPQELQDLQMLHRIRQRYVQSSTAICNQIRAYLRENGIYLDTKVQTLLKEVPGFLKMLRMN